MLLILQQTSTPCTFITFLRLDIQFNYSQMELSELLGITGSVLCSVNISKNILRRFLLWFRFLSRLPHN